MGATIERRLSAILSADAVGYSRLMSQDELGTIRALAERREIIGQRVAARRGRVVDAPGDNILAEFPSAVEAAFCALEIQQRLGDAEADVPDERRMRFRIGLHVGDVVVEGERIYGDGVNVAARLEGLAAPGGVCVSGDLYRQVVGKLDASFDDLGEQHLKNLAEPVRVYALRVGGEPAGAAVVAPPLLDRPAVAVLPFLDRSGDPEQEYLADGISEELITTLSYWRSFPVIARHSTFAYKGSDPDPRQVARELRARYVLQGSVRRAGPRLRVTAQLVDGATGHQLWAERYDRKLDDVFQLQDEISERIVASIEPELSRAEQQRALRKRPESLDAWDCSLQALWHVHQGGEARYREANRLLERAIALDPTSSHAHSVLAYCRFEQTLLGWAQDPTRTLASTRAAAQRAVALDDGDWLAHALLGIAVLWTDRDYERAVEEEERALALNPSASVSYQFLGCVLEFAGRPEEAIPHLQTVLQLNPRYQSRSLILADLALCHLLLGKLDEAVALAEQAVRQQPQNVRAHQRLTAALGLAGRSDAARSALRDLRARQPGFSLEYVDATYPFLHRADRERFVEGLLRAGFGAELHPQV